MRIASSDTKTIKLLEEHRKLHNTLIFIAMITSKRPSTVSSLFLLFTSCALIATAPRAMAVEYTWNGGNGVWTDVSNEGWNGRLPVQGHHAVISHGKVIATANNQQTALDITVKGKGVLQNGEFYLNPHALSFCDGGVIQLMNTQHYNNYGGGELPRKIEVRGRSSTGAKLLGDAVHAYWNLAPETCFDVSDITDNRNADLTISAGLKDAIGPSDTTWQSSGIVKLGRGTLRIDAVNSFSGSIQVLDGVLSVGHRGALGSGQVQISRGAKMDLDFRGKVHVPMLQIHGVTQKAGIYGASSHPSIFSGIGQLQVSSTFQSVLANAPNDGVRNFPLMKYGLFVHYVWGGSAHKVTVNSDGTLPNGLDDLAERFDVNQFAQDLASMQIEYLIFTAWHANMNCLWPSTAMNRWLKGHASKRNLIGEMIDAVRKKGIRVILYTHPRDGHDLTLDEQIATGWGGPGDPGYPDWKLFNYKKWNDFINDLYTDLLHQFGHKIDGLWLDQGTAVSDDDRMIDYKRLRETIKKNRPNLLMIQNYYGDTYSSDIGQVEFWGGIFDQPGAFWPVGQKPHAVVMGSSWCASKPQGTNVVPFSAEDMFRYTVIQAAANLDGGGVTWATGPYAGGGWEDRVLATMQRVGALLQPIRRSISHTLPSKSWVTPAGATIHSLAHGFVATRSPDHSCEFIHILKSPESNAITLPAPEDQRSYTHAELMRSGNPVSLKINPDRTLTLTLPDDESWDSLDTVIILKPVSDMHQKR